MSTPRKPGLDELVSALTADGDLDELAGRGDALAAFRAAGQRAASEPTLRQRRFVLSSRPTTSWPPTRLAALTAAAVIVIAAIATAAYTRVLPGPVQDAAHSVFAPLGVPGHQPAAGAAPSEGPAAITDATQPGSCPSCAAVFKTPSPRSGNHYVVTLSGARVRVTAGVVVVLTGRIARSGRPAAGVRVALVARTAASPQWRIVATGVTGPLGGFRFVTPPLTAGTVFRLVAPDGAYSGLVRVGVPRRSLPAGS